MKMSVHGAKGKYAVFADGERVTTNRFVTIKAAKTWAAEYKAAQKAGDSDPSDAANYNAAHGGKRAGAGRPVGTTKEPTQVVGARFPRRLVEAHQINSSFVFAAVMQQIGCSE